MGIFRKKWRCVKCNTKHRKNPEECRNCGHTVLQQVGPDEKESKSSAIQTPSTDPVATTSKKWVCNRCKQEHDEEPSNCKVCGREEFTIVENDESAPEVQTDEEYDGPSFSNIEELEEYEKQKNTTESQSTNYWWIITKLIVFCFATAAGLYFL